MYSEDDVRALYDEIFLIDLLAAVEVEIASDVQKIMEERKEN